MMRRNTQPHAPHTRLILSLFCIAASLLSLSAYAQSHPQPLDEAQVVQLFDTGNYAEIEKLHDHAVTTKEFNSEGVWQLARFYWIMQKHCDALAAKSEQEFRAKMTQWAKTYPKSVTWRILLAESLTELGWNRRGSGYASEVTSEGWKGFKQYLTEAWTLLQEARNITRQDPELYASFAHIAQGLSEDPTPGKYLAFGRGPGKSAKASPDDEEKLLAEEIFNEAIAIEPNYVNLYFYMCQVHLERWYGDSDDLEQFAERAATIAGDVMYCKIAWTMLEAWGIDMYFFECDFNWIRIKRGFEEIVREYPTSEYWKNAFCFMACFYQDRETAKTARTAIKQPMPMKVWRTKPYMVYWHDWIDEKAEYPTFNELTHAMYMRDADAVRAVVKSGESLEFVMLGGASPLTAALEINNFEIVKALVEAGADVNALNYLGHHPLIQAAYSADPSIIAYLIEHGADPNKLNRFEFSPLYQAAMIGNIPGAAALIEGKADPNLRGQKGWTALHCAVKKNQVEMVKFLLEHGADKAVKTNDGRTALDIATTDKLEPIIALLK